MTIRTNTVFVGLLSIVVIGFLAVIMVRNGVYDDNEVNGDTVVVKQFSPDQRDTIYMDTSTFTRLILKEDKLYSELALVRDTLAKLKKEMMEPKIE